VTEDPYRDPDLVELYDLDNPGGEDHAYYRALADELDAQSVIDLGCGTGLLTRSLAKPGRTVIGVDPSRTMLDYARRQPSAESVTWIHGDASALAPTGTADLAICTGNAIMQVAPEELLSTLTSVARALRARRDAQLRHSQPDLPRMGTLDARGHVRRARHLGRPTAGMARGHGGPRGSGGVRRAQTCSRTAKTGSTPTPCSSAPPRSSRESSTRRASPM
jgi:SAM-dependent methyltransferase